MENRTGDGLAAGVVRQGRQRIPTLLGSGRLLVQLRRFGVDPISDKISQQDSRL